jgi:hypothetical protein
MAETARADRHGGRPALIRFKPGRSGGAETWMPPPTGRYSREPGHHGYYVELQINYVEWRKRCVNDHSIIADAALPAHTSSRPREVRPLTARRRGATMI